MLNTNHILNLAGHKYQLAKKAKNIDVMPELISDQVKVLAQVLIEEINKELKNLEYSVKDLSKDVFDLEMKV